MAIVLTMMSGMQHIMILMCLKTLVTDPLFQAKAGGEVTTTTFTGLERALWAAGAGAIPADTMILASTTLHSGSIFISRGSSLPPC